MLIKNLVKGVWSKFINRDGARSSNWQLDETVLKILTRPYGSILETLFSGRKIPVKPTQIHSQ